MVRSRTLARMGVGYPRLMWLPGRLLAACVGLSLAEAVGLQAAGFGSALPLAPQASALAPFGVFHDLRWAFTFAASWWGAGGMLVGVVVVRATIDALMVRLAWPADVGPPPWRILFRRTAVSTLFALVLMSPWAASAFAGAAIGFSPFMLLAVIASALTALFLPSAGVTGDYWRKMLPWRGMLLVAVEWLSLMAWSLAITFSPAWVTLLVAAGGGAANALLWHRYVRFVVRAGAPRWTVPLAPVLAAAVSVGLVLISAFSITAGFHHTSHGGSPTQPSVVSARPGAPVVVYVAGFDSSYDGRPFQLFDRRIRTVHFSYRGVDADGNPLPYRPAQTHQPLTVSAQRLAEQVDALTHGGRRVDIVAESEGTLVVRAYFARTSMPPVNDLVEASPLLRPGRVYYPPAGSRGLGLIGGWEAREMVELADLVGSRVHVHADMPFMRSVVNDAPLYRDHALCPPRGVRTFLFLPMEGALTVYRGRLTAAPWTAFPAYHAELTGRPGILDDIERVVLGGTFRRHRGWNTLYDLIRGVSGAWQAPALPLSTRSRWHAAAGSDPAFGGRSCAR